MKHLRIAVLFALALVMTAGQHIWSGEDTPEKQPYIQIAILLDTSGSMSGLIDQAKTHLWKIVNEFITAEKNGRRPLLNVALYEYGNDGLSSKSGYIRQILPLTDDLDKVSEELFALTTNGGSEFCGQVIRKAVQDLKWSGSNDDLKAIFIAGNEPFTQGTVDYRKSCQSAISKGIMVNTIFCGGKQEGIDTNWKDGAMLADGSYMNIDHNRVSVAIKTPQDEEISKLGIKLNKTYVPYGKRGKESAANQTAQDSNSIKAGSFSQRAATKASGYYSNAGWDLVDAVEQKTVKLEDLKDEDLPEEMKGMTLEQKQDYLRKKAEQRKEIQDKINELTEARKKYVAAEMKKRAEKGEEKTLDSALTETLRKQAVKKEFKFK